MDNTGIYITDFSDGTISGFYIHNARSLPTVKSFTNCSLSFVMQEASLVIHGISVFDCSPAPQMTTRLILAHMSSR